MAIKRYLIIILIVTFFGSCTTKKEKVIIDTEVIGNKIEAEVTPKITATSDNEEASPQLQAEEVENKSIEDIRSTFGFKLVKIIDVQLTDPSIRYIIDFVDDDKIVAYSDPYTAYDVRPESYFLYDLERNNVLDYFRFGNDSAGFKTGDNHEMFYAYKEMDLYHYFSYNFETKESYEIERDTYRKNNKRRKYENFDSLRGNMDYIWAGYSLNPWIEIRDGTGPESYAGDEYTIGMYHGKELITVFPFLRIVDGGQFNQSPDGRYLALETGFYRNDIYRDSPPPYFPKAKYNDNNVNSGSKHDFYQYAVFIYEAVTEDNIEILDDQTVEVLTFPNPDEATAGITEVKRHIFDGSHLNVTPGEKIFWGISIKIHDGTILYREPNLDSEIVKEFYFNIEDFHIKLRGRDFKQVIIDRTTEEETINGISDYWYLLEDSFGERGWSFGDNHFDIVEEIPWFLRD